MSFKHIINNKVRNIKILSFQASTYSSIIYFSILHCQIIKIINYKLIYNLMQVTSASR